MNKISYIIVDDEESNRALISKFIKELNNGFECKGFAFDIHSGFELINFVSPSVVFLDIKMPGGSGFALLEKFVDINFEVIFISGFDEYALRAFEFNALDYVLKPIDSDKFGRTLNKVKRKIDEKMVNIIKNKAVYNSYDSQALIISKIPVHNGNIVDLIDLNEVIMVSSDSGCTEFDTITNKNHLSSKQLSDFEFILDQFANFIRVNRSIFININYIRRYSKGLHCNITMKNGKEIEVSRRKKSEILGLLSTKLI